MVQDYNLNCIIIFTVLALDFNILNLDQFVEVKCLVYNIMQLQTSSHESMLDVRKDT